jgi:hypothetical protein
MIIKKQRPIIVHTANQKNARRLMRGRGQNAGLQYAQYTHSINELEADHE